MRVLHPLQHFELIVDHLLIALDILLEDDFHSDLSRWTVCLSHNAICTRAESSAKSVFRPTDWLAWSDGGVWAVYFLS